MCGICGIVNYNSEEIGEAVLRKMCLKMRHRGPDDEGVYLYRGSPSCGLGHTRLSIIDLSPAGHQPMTNEDKSLWVTLNGEVYNYKELKEALVKKGHSFKSQADTEVILHLYEEYGKDCVTYLRGMFAFALWDEKNKSLLLARDRLGKKPLLYSYNNGKFCFASEFSALLESGLTKKDINYRAIDHYLTFGYIPAPLSIYKDAFKLAPAHRLILQNNELTVERYWDLDYSKKINISEEEAKDRVLDLLKEAVRVRLYSDVPLGAFLSGGVDSSVVVGLMSELSGKKIKTFSIGFKESGYNELKYARGIAERFNTEHHEFFVNPQAFKILPLLIERYGEPFADSSCIPTYYLSQETRKYVTVALNGDGGDELFGGYERYQAMLLSQAIPGPLRKVFNQFAAFVPHPADPKNKLSRINRFLEGLALPLEQRYIKWVGIFDSGLKGEIYSDDFMNSASLNEPAAFISPFLGCGKRLSLLDSLIYTDTMTYLPNDLLVKADIASMANSLEARSPFLDHKLIEFVAKLPAQFKIKGTIKKYILKKAVKGLIPEENINRAKMGFGVPVGRWFRSDLRDYLCENLLSEKSLKRGYFKPGEIKKMVNSHILGKKDYSACLWALLMLELWHQGFIDYNAG